VLHHLALRGLLDGGLKVRPMVLPDRFLEHDSPPSQLAAAGLTHANITATVLAALGRRARQGAGA
jgi:1-deoxy-D-xylulose-5-phosphate synthase